MFGLAAGLYQSYFAPPKLSILIVGLDGSGKTSLLERVKVTDVRTRLEVATTTNGGGGGGDGGSGGPSSLLLPASYAKGGAVVGVVGGGGTRRTAGGGGGATRDDDDDGDGDANPRRRQQQQRHEGGRPARLPPPLPPLRAAESSRRVREALQKDGFVPNGDADDDAKEDGATRDAGSGAADAVDVVRSSLPPPPLVVSGNSQTSAATAADGSDFEGEGGGGGGGGVKNGLSSSVGTNPADGDDDRPPPPPRHDSIPAGTTKPTSSSAAVLEAPVKKKKSSGFIQLLRCPSPGKYSDATLGEEDDEELVHHDDDDDDDDGDDHPVPSPTAADDAGTTTRKDALLEPWSTEYLRDYYINYRSDEEFDVRQQRQTNRRMFPLDRIRPTLGQNLARMDMCGCKCSLFDLSGSEKMRPLWERYYRDADAIVYVVNAAEKSFPNLLRSRHEYDRMRKNDALRRRVLCGLPILIFANQLDVAYEEYDASLERANDERNGRGISWNADEEDDFVGGSSQTSADGGDEGDISQRAVDFRDLAALFGFPQRCSPLDDDGRLGIGDTAQDGLGNVFMFGGSAKSGEGVRAAMEYLVAHAKSYHLGRNARI